MQYYQAMRAYEASDPFMITTESNAVPCSTDCWKEIDHSDQRPIARYDIFQLNSTQLSATILHQQLRSTVLQICPRVVFSFHLRTANLLAKT